MPRKEYSDEDYGKLIDIDDQIQSLRYELRSKYTEDDVKTSDFDDSVDYELGLVSGKYWVNAIKSGPSYRVAVSDEDGNYVDEEGTILDEPYVEAVVQISDISRLKREMVKVGKSFVETYVGNQLYKLEDERSQIESQYEEPDAMSIAHAQREEEMLADSTIIEADDDDYESDDELESNMIDRINQSSVIRAGWCGRIDDIYQELEDLGLEYEPLAGDYIVFYDSQENDDAEEYDRYYKLKIIHVTDSTYRMEYAGYEEV